MIDLPRSKFYYRSTARALNLGDAELVAIIEDIEDIEDELPRYGYRRVTHELQRRGHLINHKRVARVMRANGLGIKPRKRYRNAVPARPDMVWVTGVDVTVLLSSKPAAMRMYVKSAIISGSRSMSHRHN